MLLGAFVVDLDIANFQLKTAFNAECIDLVCRIQDKPKGCGGGQAGRRGSGSRGVLASTLSSSRPDLQGGFFTAVAAPGGDAAKFKVTRPCSPKYVNCLPAWLSKWLSNCAQ